MFQRGWINLLGGQRKAQQAVVEWDERLRAMPHCADDLGMMRVESAGERAERGQDKLGGGGDEAAARNLAAADADPQFGVEMAGQLRAYLVPLGFVAKDEAVDLGFFEDRSSAMIDQQRIMPPRQRDPDLVRIVEGIDGEVRMQMELVIRFDYGAVVPWVRKQDGALRAIGGPDGLSLWTPVDTRGVDLTTRAEFTVKKGERVPFVLVWHPSHDTH